MSDGCPSYWVVDPEEPSLTVRSLQDDEYVEVAQVVGDDELLAAAPFEVAVTPARLLDWLARSRTPVRFMMHHGVMAGGMNKRGAWGSMSERVQRPPDPSPQDPEQPEPQPAPQVKHCWVSDEHGRLPGLLLEWRRTESGFQGRVVRPVFEDGWILVDEWLPAALLQPA